MPERRSECGRASSEQESGGPLGPATQQAASNNPYMDVCLWHHRRRNFFLSLSLIQSSELVFFASFSIYLLRNVFSLIHYFSFDSI